MVIPAFLFSRERYSCRMEKRTPVDKYSRNQYQASLDSLAEKEGEKLKHPLQAELATHEELQRESPVPYPFAEEKKRAETTLDAETAEIQAEIEKIKKDLIRQLGNAQTEANEMNDETESKKLAQQVLPEIAKVKGSIQSELAKNENLPRRAQSFGRQVLVETDRAERDIT